jgi:hypothetical protein
MKVHRDLHVLLWKIFAASVEVLRKFSLRKHVSYGNWIDRRFLKGYVRSSIILLAESILY